MSKIPGFFNLTLNKTVKMKKFTTVRLGHGPSNQTEGDLVTLLDEGWVIENKIEVPKGLDNKYQTPYVIVVLSKFPFKEE